MLMENPPKQRLTTMATASLLSKSLTDPLIDGIQMLPHHFSNERILQVTESPLEIEVRVVHGGLQVVFSRARRKSEGRSWETRGPRHGWREVFIGRCRGGRRRQHLPTIPFCLGELLSRRDRKRVGGGGGTILPLCHCDTKCLRKLRPCSFGPL